MQNNSGRWRQRFGAAESDCRGTQHKHSPAPVGSSGVRHLRCLFFASLCLEFVLCLASGNGIVKIHKESVSGYDVIW